MWRNFFCIFLTSEIKCDGEPVDTCHRFFSYHIFSQIELLKNDQV